MSITCDDCGKEFWMDEVEEPDYELRKGCAKFDGWLFKKGFVFCPDCKNKEDGDE